MHVGCLGARPTTALCNVYKPSKNVHSRGQITMCVPPICKHSSITNKTYTFVVSTSAYFVWTLTASLLYFSSGLLSVNVAQVLSISSALNFPFRSLSSLYLHERINLQMWQRVGAVELVCSGTTRLRSRLASLPTNVLIWEFDLVEWFIYVFTITPPHSLAWENYTSTHTRRAAVLKMQWSVSKLATNYSCIVRVCTVI